MRHTQRFLDSAVMNSTIMASQAVGVKVLSAEALFGGSATARTAQEAHDGASTDPATTGRVDVQAELDDLTISVRLPNGEMPLPCCDVVELGRATIMCCVRRRNAQD